ncbi:MAG: carboxypeptidase-like regulatory domain-containing protein, partial [Acidobacteriota bacterium]|nr:carboxypeptidase-like regulatory domain-containing protein [Acidobacteriota bacterium]
MLRVLAGLAICISLLPIPIYSQSATAADLEGTVTDPAGGTISGAELAVTNTETGAARQGTTNSLGRFRIPALPAGSYGMRISKTGFASVERKGLTLQIGQVVTLDIQLPVAAQAQEITISAAAPIVETGRASVGAVINRAEIDNLPTNGRNFLDFSRTVAGVTGQQT